MNDHSHYHHGFGQDAASWDERYRSADRIWSGNPNPQLVAEIASLTPGRALDAGCGEGADALWLARHDWDVVAVDISVVALERAAEHARTADPEASERIEWRQADLLASPPEPESFDLVSSQFFQLPPEPRARLFSALAATVHPGGVLLVVGHDPSDLTTGVSRPPLPERFYTSEDIAALLDSSWTVIVSEARPRSAMTPGGVEATIHDAVLLARRELQRDSAYQWPRVAHRLPASGYGRRGPDVEM